MSRTHEQEQDSPVIQAMKLVRRNANEVGQDSEPRFFRAMREQLALCIKAGFRFELEDFREMFSGLGAYSGGAR